MTKARNEVAAVQAQYHTSANLEARIRLHTHFSTNPYGWLRWVFDQIAAPTQAQILEIGCGPATLWVENHDRIPAGWQITLTDQSAGMIQQAQANVASLDHAFHFEQVNAEAIPFPAATFDRVIANHMLYHVSDLPQALREIQRVLKPGGWLYAATNGQDHMRELRALIQGFDPTSNTLAFAAPPERLFSLENGAAQLAPWFPSLERRDYIDGLAVTDVNALVDYVFSMSSFGNFRDSATARQAFTAYAESQMQEGVFLIGKVTGLFIGQKP
ncbi:MAG: methyltransferase domain-containing protein [Caldilineaceae bacterium]|nr:methyltransferase domain-containing protein [Caldilineaceae bacterium]